MEMQCHPNLPVLATSGIESIVRLWSPEGPADMSDCSAAILNNQQRMQDGPQLLRGINPAVIQVLELDRDSICPLKCGNCLPSRLNASESVSTVQTGITASSCLQMQPVAAYAAKCRALQLQYTGTMAPAL